MLKPKYLNMILNTYIYIHLENIFTYIYSNNYDFGMDICEWKVTNPIVLQVGFFKICKISMPIFFLFYMSVILAVTDKKFYIF